MIIVKKEHLNTISKAINEYAGIVLERIPQNRVEKKIIDQMKQLDCHNINDFVELLKNYKNNSKIMDSFISEITISESYIFRNPKQFEYMINSFFPEFFKKNNYEFPLRIWSAGCSHGEEPYSIAMIAKDFIQKNPKAKFVINAGDIDKTCLSEAQKGIYKSKAMHGKIEYFENKLGFHIGKRDNNGNCLISQDIKDMVDFHWLNLKNISKIKIMQGSDIIFCRNVLIYFDEVLRKKILETFYDYLNPNGLLFIGESECFSFPSNTFELLDNKGSYAYRKPGSK